MVEPRDGWRRLATQPAVASTLFGLTVVATIAILIVIMIGRDPSSWYRGLSLDFPYYVWRTNIVSHGGLDALVAEVPGINLERPGFPVLGSLLGSIIRVDTVTLVHGVQLAATVGIGLAAGAFAVAVLEERRWSFPVFAVMTAASSGVAWTSLKSLDNLLVDAVILAIALAAIRSAVGARGRLAAIAGFGSIALIHWFFASLFLALLGGVTAVLVPWSVVAWRRGTKPLQTPAVRLGITVVGGAIAGVASLVALAPAPPAGIPPTEGDRGNATRLPSLRLPVTGPLAVLGAIALWFPANTKRRIGLVLLALWALTVPLAMLASEVLDRPIKVFRVAGFAIAIPILGAAALVAAVRLGRRFGVAGRVAGALVLAAGIAFGISSSASVYRMPAADQRSAVRLDQVRATNSYLETAPPDRPLVFLVSRRNPFLLDRLVRAGLPPDRILDARLYWGGIEDLLAGRPGAQETGSANVGRNWWNLWWRDAEGIIRDDPIVFYLRSLNPVLGPPADARVLAPGVLLALGPPPVASPAAPAPLGTSWPTMAGTAIAVLLLLGLVGSGWTRSLLRVDRLAWLGLSPAVGIAATSLLGTALGRIGVPLGGTSGVVVILAIAMAGWIPHLFARGRSEGRHAAVRDDEGREDAERQLSPSDETPVTP